MSRLKRIIILDGVLVKTRIEREVMTWTVTRGTCLPNRDKGGPLRRKKKYGAAKVVYQRSLAKMDFAENY